MLHLPNNVSPDTLLRRRDVQARYGGISHMWIERRLKDSEFPAPLYIAKRRYWRLGDLIAWEQKVAAQESEHRA